MAYSVLIVDDSLTVRMDLQEAFQAGGFAPRTCATGAETRSALAAGPVDAVVLDVCLPDADGLELLTELRSDPSREDTVVVLLSSEAEVTDRVHGLRSGADEYVGKPYDPGYLVARTRQLVRERSSPVPDQVTVLVIDDSLTFREELRRVLQQEGHAVVTAASGEEGLYLAADVRPNVIIVDGVMPGLDGASVIRRIRLDAALRDIPCLLLTAADDDTTELRMLDSGADAFVRKQEDPAILLAQVAVVLRRGANVAPTTAASVHGPTKVLAVDADRTRLSAIGDALRADGHEVVLAHTTVDALALLAVQPVDCVVFDLDQLGGAAAMVIQHIRAVPVLRNTPVVTTGERGGADALLESLAAGADDYLGKSESLPILCAHVRAQIRRKQLQDESQRIREELLHSQLEAAEARAARELAETRAALVEELEWRNRELEAFSGSVSHDLRGPLQIISTYAEELLDEGAPTLPAPTRHGIERINAAATRMRDLVESLLLLSRASRGEITFAPVDLSALAREVVAEFQRREPDRPVEAVVQDSMRTRGDRGLLRVALENLIGNAWKFTRRTAKPRIEVDAARAGPDLAYAVRDNGAGFPAAKVEQLFRPFHRLHGQEEYPGTGIGLTTVQRIIERHGGRIWAEGEAGQGATFRFTLRAPRDGTA